MHYLIHKQNDILYPEVIPYSKTYQLNSDKFK